MAAALFAAAPAAVLAFLATFAESAQPVLSLLEPAQPALLWAALCFLLHHALLHLFFPARGSKLTPARRVDLANTAVSSVHATILFAGAVAHALPLWDARAPLSLLRPTSVCPNTPVQNLWCERMLGYLLYDCVLGVARPLDALIWVHHLLGVVSLGSQRLANCGGSYLMLVHLAEGSTPFLHAATSLHALHCDSWLLYRAAAVGTLITFSTLRTFVQPQVWWHLLHSREQWEAGGDGGGALWAFQLVVDGCFVLLNLFWWTKLLQRAFGKGGKPKLSKGKGRKDSAPAAEVETTHTE